METIATDVQWGSSPKIFFDFSYEKKREGAAQYYKILVSCKPLLTSESYFGYPIYVAISLDNTHKTYFTLKEANPAQWSTVISHTTDWISVNNKTSGETNLTIRVYSGLSTSREGMDCSYSLAIDPAARRISCSSANIEETASVYVYPESGEFTHSIYCEFGEITGYLNDEGELTKTKTKLSRTSIGFPIPFDFYGQIPDKPYMDCTLTCCTYDEDTQIGDPQATTFRITANESRCAPVVSGEVVDVNPKTTALTGDRNKLVKFMSDARCKIIAEAKNEAWLIKKAVNGSKEVAFEDSEEDGEDIEVIKGIETDTFFFQAYDSRGYCFKDSNNLQGGYRAEDGYRVNKTLIPYQKLTVSSEVRRDTPTDECVKLTLKGLCFTGDFAEGVSNSVSAICWVSEENSIKMDVVCKDGGYIATAEVLDLDYHSSHTIHFVVSDELMSIEGKAVVKRGIPVFDWGEKDFAFHVPVAAEGGINGVHIGSFSSGGLYLTTAQLPQSFLIAGGGVLGILAVTEDSCTWQGTEGATAAKEGDLVKLQFAEETNIIILSNSKIIPGEQTQ